MRAAEISASQLRSPVDYRTSGRGMALNGVELTVMNSDVRGFGGYFYGTTSVVDAVRLIDVGEPLMLTRPEAVPVIVIG